MLMHPDNASPVLFARNPGRPAPAPKEGGAAQPPHSQALNPPLRSSATRDTEEGGGGGGGSSAVSAPAITNGSVATAKMIPETPGRDCGPELDPEESEDVNELP